MAHHYYICKCGCMFEGHASSITCPYCGKSGGFVTSDFVPHLIDWDDVDRYPITHLSKDIHTVERHISKRSLVSDKKKYASLVEQHCKC